MFSSSAKEPHLFFAMLLILFKFTVDQACDGSPLQDHHLIHDFHTSCQRLKIAQEVTI